MFLQADDTLVYRRITDDIDAHALQNDLIPVPVTYRSEKIRGAIAQKHKPLITQYIVYNRQPKTVDSAQYLGVQIDSKLDFSIRIDSSVEKATGIQVIGTTEHSFLFCVRPKQTLLTSLFQTRRRICLNSNIVMTAL